MSLINEALKKAQKQQLDAAAKDNGSVPPTGNPPPPPKDPPSAPAAAAPEPESDPIFSARRQRRRGGKGKWVVLVAAIVIIGGTGVVLSSRDSNGSAVAVKPTPQDPTPASVGAPVSLTANPKETAKPVEQVAAAKLTEVPTPSVALPPSLVVTPVPEPKIEEAAPIAAASTPTQSKPIAGEKVEPRPVPAVTGPGGQVHENPPVSKEIVPPSPSAGGAKLARTTVEPVESDRTTPSRPRPASKVVIETLDEPSASNMADSKAQGAPASGAVLDYLEKARVTGIRVSTTDPKVLMNNRVYRLNEIVDRDLQLRVVHIAPRELRFQDAQGHVYRKTF